MSSSLFGATMVPQWCPIQSKMISSFWVIVFYIIHIILIGSTTKKNYSNVLAIVGSAPPGHFEHDFSVGSSGIPEGCLCVIPASCVTLLVLCSSTTILTISGRILSTTATQA